jgi:hypothetical protein
MKVHANAALGPAGRIAVCEAIESGMTFRSAAAALNVAPATAHRWWHRKQAASACELRAGSWLCDRSSRPHRQPRRLSAAQEEPILRARRETGLGPGRLAGIVRRARSTIWKVLYRHGLSRRPPAPRQSTRRYEWSRPGALLHVDTSRLARFTRPGHKVLGRSTKAAVAVPRWATRSCTPALTITPVTPTSSSTPTSEPRPRPASCGERSSTSQRSDSTHQRQ